MGMTQAKNSRHFAGANGNAKLVRAIVRLVRRARLDYEGFRRVCAQVRRSWRFAGRRDLEGCSWPNESHGIVPKESLSALRSGGTDSARE